MDEIVKPIGEWISQNIPLSVGICVFIFCIFFEVSKIKVYPLKWLWKAISWPFRKIDEQRTNSFKNLVVELKSDIDEKLSAMKDVTSMNCDALKGRFDKLEVRLDKMDERQKATDERLDMLAAARIKNHVLNFARQCRRGESHSHEDFANLIKENKEYESLISKYKWTNDVYKHDFAYILREYDRCNNENDFLD